MSVTRAMFCEGCGRAGQVGRLNDSLDLCPDCASVAIIADAVRWFDEQDVAATSPQGTPEEGEGAR